TTRVVEELIARHTAAHVAALRDLAARGNLRALQVLAGSKQPAALDDLLGVVNGGDTPARVQIALAGLALNWPAAAAETFTRRLADPNPAVVRLAVLGLARSGDPAARPLIEPLLAHADPDCRLAAAAALDALASGSFPSPRNE